MQSPILVGRSEETSALRAAVARAEQHRGGAVFLVGEPGIGKSRLAAEIAAHAVRHGFRVLKGRASSAVPLRALMTGFSRRSTARRGGRTPAALDSEGCPASPSLMGQDRLSNLAGLIRRTGDSKPDPQGENRCAP